MCDLGFEPKNLYKNFRVISVAKEKTKNRGDMGVAIVDMFRRRIDKKKPNG